MRALIFAILVGCGRPAAPPGPIIGHDPSFPDGEQLVFEGALPFAPRGQAVGVVSSGLGHGPELLRIDHQTHELESLIVSSGPAAWVLDGEIGANGEAYLVGTTVDLRLVLWGVGGFLEPWPIGGVRGGAFVLGEPVVAVADGNESCWVRFVEAEISHPFDVACPSRVPVVARERGAFLALGRGGLWHAREGAVQRVAEVADGVSYDDATDQVIAHAGYEGMVFAIDPETLERRWQVEAEVFASVALPGRGVLWAERSGVGSALVLADLDGSERERLHLDWIVRGLSAAPDASRVGIVFDAAYATYLVPP